MHVLVSLKAQELSDSCFFLGQTCRPFTIIPEGGQLRSSCRVKHSLPECVYVVSILMSVCVPSLRQTEAKLNEPN